MVLIILVLELSSSIMLHLPQVTAENQKLQGGKFDHANRLFNSVRDMWLSAVGKGHMSDVKELIPEFFYMLEFLENRFNLDQGEGSNRDGLVSLPLMSPRISSKGVENLDTDSTSDLSQ